MELPGIHATDTTRKQASTIAMLNPGAVHLWNVTSMYVSVQVHQSGRCISSHTSAVLQPLGEPRAVCQALRRAVCQDGEEDGRDADDLRLDMDRGSVHEEGGRRGLQMPHDLEVDVRDGAFPRKGQQEANV